MKKLSILLLSVFLSVSIHAETITITGAGATFPYPIYAKWSQIYKLRTNVSINYQPIGSGGGIKQILAKTVDFGASDKPLSNEELNKAGLIQFPTVMGGIVPVLNVPGIDGDKIQLTGPILADIYLGKITQWNDAKITSINPNISLPNTKITVVHRSDGSGTTFLFTNYLSKTSNEWKAKVGNDSAVAWPTGIGGKGNEGVAFYVQRIKGSIGYVEYAYAKQNNLAYTKLQNKTGQVVTPTIATFQAAATNAQWNNQINFSEVLTDEPGAESWPITGATFILMYKTQENAENAKQVLNFFRWAYHDGKSMTAELDYVPMPDSVVTLVENYWRQNIKDTSGKPIE